MKFLFVIFVLFLVRCECRVASVEAEVQGETVTEKGRLPLHYPCVFRSLKAGDKYPSVVVRWHEEIQRLTWDEAGNAVIEQNYKPQTVSVSYPSSGGLSGGAPSSTSVDPFKDAPVVPADYNLDEIKTWFETDCFAQLPKGH